LTSSVHVAALSAASGQGWLQVGELLLAFALSSVVGLERQLRGKSAGLRTQAIVGTAAALILLVSKYGFADVLVPGSVVLDPSRVAAQIVSGVGFLGAGLIITRRGSIRGLTTAAAVWETAAIGMAAGAGLPVLAVVVTVLHFVIVLGYTPLTRRLPGAHRWTASYTITYTDGHGVLRELLAACTGHEWSVSALRSTEVLMAEDVGPLTEGDDAGRQRLVSVTVDLTGPGADDAVAVLGGVDGVTRVERFDDDSD
jgi:putative Mg2+ transporter-C (MgtC) family protein